MVLSNTGFSTQSLLPGCFPCIPCRARAAFLIGTNLPAFALLGCRHCLDPCVIFPSFSLKHNRETAWAGLHYGCFRHRNGVIAKFTPGGKWAKAFTQTTGFWLCQSARLDTQQHSLLSTNFFTLLAIFGLCSFHPSTEPNKEGMAFAQQWNNRDKFTQWIMKHIFSSYSVSNQVLILIFGRDILSSPAPLPNPRKLFGLGGEPNFKIRF